MDYTYRKILEKDWVGLLDVEEKAFGGGFSKYFLRMVPRFYGRNSYVVEREKEIVGYCLGVIPNGLEKEGWIMSIGISPTHQGKGIGSHLLNLTIDALKENNVERIYLTVSPDNYNAIKSYEKKGFKKIDFKEDYYGKDEHRIVMELK